MTSDADAIERCRADLIATAEKAEIFLSGDFRISEPDLARLLGISSLKNLRVEGRGPVPTYRPLNGSRVSYAMLDVAIWIIAGRGDQ